MAEEILQTLPVAAGAITQPLPSPTNAGAAAAAAEEEEPAPPAPVEVNRTEGDSLDGTLKVWNVDKGFGFVTMEDGGPDLFVHQSAITVEGDRYRAILPGTTLTCVYYLREGKETAREVCMRGGAALPGFSSKLEAAQKLSLATSVAGRPGVLTGTIKFMNKDKGFGFIIPDAGGDDMFVHVGDIDGQQILNQGEPVAYTTAVKKGTRPQAVEVTPLRPRYPAYPPHHSYGHPPPYGGYPPQHGYDQYGYPSHSQYGPPHDYGEYPHGNMHGRVKWFNEAKGFGFIVPDTGGPDVYFKGQDVQGGGPALVENEFVNYEMKSASDGKLWAGSVARIRVGPVSHAGGKRGGKHSPEMGNNPAGGRLQGQGYSQASPQHAQQQGQYQGGYSGQSSQYGSNNPQYLSPQSGGQYQQGRQQYAQQQSYGQQQNGSYAQSNGQPSYNGASNGQPYGASPSISNGQFDGQPAYPQY